jgi:hypothetical protein
MQLPKSVLSHWKKPQTRSKIQAWAIRARTYLSSLTSWSGTVDVFWDETDTTGQGALTIGAEVTLNLYPEGDTAADTYYTGTAIVTSRSVSSSFDGMVEASIGVQGNGALTETTV